MKEAVHFLSASCCPQPNLFTAQAFSGSAEKQSGMKASWSAGLPPDPPGRPGFHLIRPCDCSRRPESIPNYSRTAGKEGALPRPAKGRLELQHVCVMTRFRSGGSQWIYEENAGLYAGFQWTSRHPHAEREVLLTLFSLR